MHAPRPGSLWASCTLPLRASGLRSGTLLGSRAAARPCAESADGFYTSCRHVPTRADFWRGHRCRALYECAFHPDVAPATICQRTASPVTRHLG